MLGFAALAVLGGALVSSSRQINGSLSMYTSALHSSYWNHVVGFAFITAVGIAFGGLFMGDPWGAPWWAYLGGPIGFVFIAASSWAVLKIGAAQTAMLIIAGQMISGVAVDIALGTEGNTTTRIIGVALILAGMLVARSGAKPKANGT
ncbi:DMT family transporter [Loktanella sp. F6476L]|uniref:DMT family transporter n=1 Tax=Loktanella sp. F6476L TaxID=2926405 RepID=UPI001FF5C3EB|nr:DMT family transporter [Loktanella sp. F6476L]MCK0120268.1 DMT family transporter [Loktanella sp. F6476L]